MKVKDVDKLFDPLKRFLSIRGAFREFFLTLKTIHMNLNTLSRRQKMFGDFLRKKKGIFRLWQRCFSVYGVNGFTVDVFHNELLVYIIDLLNNPNHPLVVFVNQLIKIMYMVVSILVSIYKLLLSLLDHWNVLRGHHDRLLCCKDKSLFSKISRRFPNRLLGVPVCLSHNVFRKLVNVLNIISGYKNKYRSYSENPGSIPVRELFEFDKKTFPDLRNLLSDLFPRRSKNSKRSDVEWFNLSFLFD